MPGPLHNTDTNEHTEYTVVVGNPGVGKSTLLNGLAGRIVFKSGSSGDGKGLTKKMQREAIIQGKEIIIDTPGLDDPELRELACKEIKEALSQHGKYRVIFVVQLNAGRVMGADSATIALVLGAVPKDTPFAIVINKATKKFIKKMQEGTPEYKDQIKGILLCLQKASNRATTHFHITEMDSELEDEDNMMPDNKITEALKKFLEQVPLLYVKRTEVSDIREGEYGALVEQMNRMQANFEKDKEQQAKLYTELEKFRREENERWEKRLEEQKEELYLRTKEMEKRREEQAAEMQREAEEARLVSEKRFQEVQKQHEEQLRVIDAKNAADKAERDKELAKEQEKFDKMRNKSAASHTLEWLLNPPAKMCTNRFQGSDGCNSM